MTRLPTGLRATLLLACIFVLPAQAAAVCGDSILDPGEECEVGPNGDAACQEACVPPILPDGCQCAYPAADPRSYVALADLRIRLAQRVVVTAGNVGVSGSNGYLLVGDVGRLPAGGHAVANRVKVRELAEVGRLFANSAAVLPAASIQDGGPFAFTVPLTLVPPLPSLATGTPDLAPITVAAGTSSALTPGTYGDVIVDRGATLTLQGLSPGSGAGRYDVRSMSVIFGGRLLADNPVDVRIAERLRVLPTAEVGPSPATSALAGDVRLDVAGLLVRIGHNATVRAHVRANRKIGMGKAATVVGQLIAPSLKAAADAQLTLEGGCGDERLDAGEPCDGSAAGGDAACPGACVAWDLPGQCTCP